MIMQSKCTITALIFSFLLLQVYPERYGHLRSRAGYAYEVAHDQMQPKTRMLDMNMNIGTSASEEMNDTAIPSKTLSVEMNYGKVSSTATSLSLTRETSSTNTTLETPDSECNDLESYRSPIIGFTCEEHRNKDCFKWKDLGLTDEQLVTLLESCPIACNVDCGYTLPPSNSPSGLQSDATFEISIYISNLSSDLNEDEIVALEELTGSYLTDKLRLQSKMIETVSFQILSQETINGNRQLRGLIGMTGGITVKIIGKVSVMISGEGSSTTTDLLEFTKASFESGAYEKFLNAKDRFSDVTIFLKTPNEPMKPPGPTDPMKEPKAPNPSNNEDTGRKRPRSSTAGIVTSVILISIFVTAAIFFWRKKSSSLSPRLKHGQNDMALFSDQSRDDPSSYSGADDANGTVDHSRLSRALSHIASEDSPLDFMLEAPRGEFGGCLKEEESERGQEEMQHPEFMKNDPPALDQHSYAASPPQETQLPTVHIPPMIVIDNIDDEEMPTPVRYENTDATNASANDGSPEQYEDEEDQTEMFVKRIEATSDLVAAFSARKAPNPMQAYNLLHPLKISPVNGDETSEVYAEEASPHTVLSSRLSIGEAASTMSTPSNVRNGIDETDVGISPPEQKPTVFPFGPESSFGPKDDFNVLFSKFEKKMKEGEKPNQKRGLRSFFKRKKPETMGRDSSPMADFHYESDADMSLGSAILRERDRIEDSQTNLPHVDTSQDEYLLKQDYKSDSSTDYSPDEMVTTLSNDEDSQEISMQQEHARTLSSTSFSLSHKRTFSDFSLSKGYKYRFLAPATGKLGIQIQGNGRSAPTIFQVKNWSPLFEQVLPGDKIVAIDGEDTARMSKNEITNLLAMKRDSMNATTRKIAFTVMSSKYRKEGLQPDAVQSTIPEQIDTRETIDPRRDDLEITSETENIRENTSYENYSEDEQSCHLLGTSATDEFEDEEFLHCEHYGGNDQLL